MLTITVCAYNRPDYLRIVLTSLLTALRECPEMQQAKIVIGVDPGGDRQAEVVDQISDFRDIFQIEERKAPELIVWPKHLGVSEHPRRLLQYVFMEMRSEFNVHLEDDTVLSPDALRLAWWYWQRARHEYIIQPIAMNRVLCMSLHSRSCEENKTVPAAVRFRSDFCPWGWCCTYLAWWLWFSHYWNFKRSLPAGFDWSASLMMRKHDLWALEPALSRVHNIGREGGEHQTPEGYDRDMQGLVWAAAVHNAEFVLDERRPARPAWEWGE
jgi:hypothetical protein